MKSQSTKKKTRNQLAEQFLIAILNSGAGTSDKKYNQEYVDKAFDLADKFIKLRDNK